MSARVWRIELRRSAGWWTALAIALIGATMLYAVLSSWGARWTPFVLVQREQLYVLWPLALGAGAWQALRESRGRVGELLASTARPRWQRVAPTAGAMALGAVTGYLVMFLGGAVAVAPWASYFPAAAPLVVAVGALALVAAVWIGLAIGGLLPSPFTPPAVVLGGLLALMAVPVATGGGPRPGATLLSPVLPPLETDFSAVVTRVQLTQTLWLSVLAAAALAIHAAARPLSRIAALAPVAAAAVLAVSLLPAQDRAAYVPDPASYAQVCTPDAPRVCVTRVHAAALEDLRGPARQALAVLSAKLPEPPTSVAESHTSWLSADRQAQPAGTLLVELNVNGQGRVEQPPQRLLWWLLDGAGTRPCPAVFQDPDGPAYHRHQAARLAVAGWLLDESPPAGYSYSDRAVQAWEALRGLPAGEQQTRVTELRRAAVACDGRDLLDVLAATAQAPR